MKTSDSDNATLASTLFNVVMGGLIEKTAKHLYKIDPGSEVKGTAGGHYVCTTTPDHSSGLGYKIPDHKKYYVPVHVVVMENHLGRNLKRGEEVHHKDENKSNNALSNLELKSHSDHARDHAHKKKFWKKSPRTKPGTRKAVHNIIAKFRDIS